MKKLILIAVFLLGGVISTTSFAQVPTVDAVKTPTKIGRIAADAKNKAEQAVKWVSESKMGKFVGDSIKAAKDGIAYAKDMYEGGMEIYGNVQDKIADAKDSNAYKAAEISKEIAGESKKLQQLQEQKLQISENLKQEQEIATEEMQAKAAALDSNHKLTIEAYREQGKTEEELQEYEEQYNKDAEEISNALELKIADINNELESQTDEIETQIKEQMKKIAKHTKELQELSGKEITVSNPLEAIQETQEELFLQDGEKLTISKEQELREKWYTERRNVIYQTYQKSLQAKSQLDGLREKVASIKEMADAMPGESENANVNIEVIIKQGELLQKYIDFVLADLMLESTIAVTSLPDYNPSPRLNGKFKLCNYTDAKSGLAALKEKAQAAQDKVSGAVAKGQQLKQKYDDAKSKVDDVKEIAGQGQEVIKNIDQLKGQAATPSALEGML